MRKDIVDELSSYGNIDKVDDYKKFFKTSKGKYAEGDQFLEKAKEPEEFNLNFLEMMKLNYL